MSRRAIPCFALLLVLFAPIVDAKKKPKDDPAQTDALTAETFAGLKLRGIGPALMSGRIADIAIHPTRRSTWYVAVGSGGVWKTTNSGTTWNSIFDGQGSYSTGCVTLDPVNPEIVWVGSGENVSGRHVGFGDGIYRSLDGGKTWKNLGLGETEHISKILIDPRDTDVIYVAAEGPLWTAGGERGVYKSIDGGKTWARSLEIDDDTGVTDLEFDPRNPDIVYAAAYQRRRSVGVLMAGGPGSGIYKTTDAGAEWRKLGNGLPKGDMGRIGLSVSPVDPDVVYATIEADRKSRGFYRSTNSGESWEKRNGYVSGGTGPHYYQEIYASPHKRDRVYQMDVWMRVTEDGGKTFERLGEPHKHSDNHALAFDPDDPDYLLAGSDGGLYETFDHGKSWKFFPNLPLTQFYKMCLDYDTPFYNVIGGTQDNGTQSGPSRTMNVHGIRNSDWSVPLGADGYGCAADPQDPDLLYVEWQRGNLQRHDRKTGESIDVKPQPAPGDPPERFNWDAPILISPHSNSRLYFGSQRLWRSDDRGDSWRPVSGDLSRGENRYEMPIMGRVWSVDDLYDLGAMSWYGNLTAISESPVVEGLIYAGTDDGLIQVTEDGGESWRRVESLPGVAEMFFVNDVKASIGDGETVFVAVDQHKTGDLAPHLYKSVDRGRTWTSIAGDLPERHLVWSIEQDHVNPDLLFAGTEFGLFFTLDGGEHWLAFTGGAPTIPYRDIEIQRRESDLVGSTFGRGFWILDDYSPLRAVTPELLEQDAALFPVKPTLLYVPSTPLAVRGKGYQGGSLFTAPNPPYGAVFTYYMKEPAKNDKQTRKEREKKIRKEQGDVPFPGWDTLATEAREEDPRVVLTVRDAAGEVVRHVAGADREGLQRVVWDLRYPSSRPTSIRPAGDLPPWARSPSGPRVVPGGYTVELFRIVDNDWTSLAGPEPFDVVPLERATLPGQDPAEVLEFQKRTADLERRMQGASAEISRTDDRLKHMKKAVLDTPGADPALLARIRAVEDDLHELRVALSGDRTRRRYSEPSAPSPMQRLRTAKGHWNTLHGPTQTHRESFEIARKAYEEIAPRLRRLIDTDVASVEADLEAAGAPWTPGRIVPDAR